MSKRIPAHEIASYVENLGAILKREDDNTHTETLKRIADLAETVDWLRKAAVEEARIDGTSWEQIGTALGISKQAVQKRHNIDVERAVRMYGPLLDQSYEPKPRPVIQANADTAQANADSPTTPFGRLNEEDR
jgi:DNA-directed RNA polymerase specialized sigma24 family protein